MGQRERIRRRRSWRVFLGVGAFLIVLGTVGVSGAVAATANFEFDPPTYNFGRVPYVAGPTAPHEFTLTNTGETQLAIKYWRSQWVAYWPEVPDPFSVTSSNCHTLEPDESCTFDVVFDPIHPGIWRGWQRVKSQVEEEPWVELELRGEGTGPWIPIAPEHVVFGPVSVGVTTKPQTITLESQGREDFRIEHISTAPAGGSLTSTPFQVVGGSCHEGESLAPGQTCTIEVVMAPTVSGLIQSKLEITDTAPDSPQSVGLEGTATAVAADAQPPTSGDDGTAAPTGPAASKRTCPRGKRKVVKKGRRICVKRHRHRRRHPRAAK